MYRKASLTPVAENFNRRIRRMSGQDGDVNTGGIRDPSPNKAHLIPTEKAKRKEKAGDAWICLGNEDRCCRPASNVEFLLTLRGTGLGDCKQHS